MTIEQAKSELMQIYGALSPDKQRAIDTLVKIEPCEDAISRQAAIKAFQMFREYESNRNNKEWVDRIETVLNQLPPVNPQEPKYCDRNMCIKNEYNGIGCDECEVTKSQEPKMGHWIYDKTIENWRCSKCNETPKTMGHVGTADFMAEHFKFCNHCGCRMVEPQESEEV